MPEKYTLTCFKQAFGPFISYGEKKSFLNVAPGTNIIKLFGVSYQKSDLIFNIFTKIRPGVNLIKLFGVNLLTVFCKLDNFINVSNIYGIALKRPSLQKELVNLCPKKIYGIDPWFDINCAKMFYSIDQWRHFIKLT